MKKFAFSMQGVLNVRASEFEARKLELAKARAALREEEERLAAIHRDINRALSANPGRLTSTYYLVQRERYVRLLKDRRKKQELKVKAAEAEVEKRVKLLSLAKIELRKMEKASEREKKKWSLDYLREEQKIIDETGTTQASRRAREVAV